MIYYQETEHLCSVCVLCTLRRFCCVTVSSRERVSELEQEVETLNLNLLNVQQSNLKVNNKLQLQIFFLPPQLFVVQFYPTLFCNG